MTFPASSNAAAAEFSALPLFAVDGNKKKKREKQVPADGGGFHSCRVFAGYVAGCCIRATLVGVIEQTNTLVFVRTDTRYVWNEIWQHRGFSLCASLCRTGALIHTCVMFTVIQAQSDNSELNPMSLPGLRQYISFRFLPFSTPLMMLHTDGAAMQ